MIEIERDEPMLSHTADSMLALVIHRVVHGEATTGEVTSVLRRVCDESRTRPAESMLLRIKELWTKVAGMPRAARDDRDRRYFAFVGEALELYFASPPVQISPRRLTYADGDGCGEPEVFAPS